MADARPEYLIDFPTLFVAADWVQAHCVVPDGFEKGDPFVLVDWQAWALLNFYRLKPSARVGQLAPAFHYRRSQIVLPPKAGKAPYTAAHVCVEGVGPALFAGWAEGGERWDCRDYGCGCGWAYEYRPGEPMGMQWPTPLIQITATAEEQTDNVYSALRPMIDDGPLAELIPHTGEEFIRLPHGGRIDRVTSNARSRLGARVTFVPADETGYWTARAGMIAVAEVQRRGLAGMGGRTEETTNAWDPAVDSTARRTAQSARKDIFRLHPLPPKGLSYRNKAERRRIHRSVYRGCRWVDLDAIEGEAAEEIEHDAGQAERFYGNRLVAGAGKAFDIEQWHKLADPAYEPPEGALVTLGIDGARYVDAFAAVATEVETGYQWPVAIEQRPLEAPREYEHSWDRIDGAVAELFESGRFSVWRAYADKQWIEDWFNTWQGRYGKERVHAWLTNRPRQIAWAVRNYEGAIANATFKHDGSRILATHIENSVKQMLNVRDDKHRLMHTIAKDHADSPAKIDAAMAAVLSWEARGDAIAAGATQAPDPTDLLNYRIGFV